MAKRCRVTIRAALGATGVRTIQLARIEAYQCETSIDNDADAFSLDIGDPGHQLTWLMDRDTEVRCMIEATDELGRWEPIFTGIADQVQYSSDDQIVSIQGRDLSCLATDTDAPPGKWRWVEPKVFIPARDAGKRGRQGVPVGLHNFVIEHMGQTPHLFTDASETEWEFWYRIVRQHDKWMWTGPNGAVFIKSLAYTQPISYQFGPPQRGAAGWIVPEVIDIRSDKQSRRGQVWVYAQNKKAGHSYVAIGKDIHITGWSRRPLKIINNTVATTQKGAKKAADLEVFESIVGTQELQLTVHDTGINIKQNTMARVSIPQLGIAGNWFIVGVTRQGGPDGHRQIVRLRQKGFAISTRKPEAPTLQEDPVGNPIPPTDTTGKDPGSISAGLKGIRWAASFVNAAKEHQGEWDFAIFLATLLGIASHESAGDTNNFRNVRGTVSGAISNVEWEPLETFLGANRSLGRSVEDYRATFANDKHNPRNPRYPGSNDAVGPMQLVSDGYIAKADRYGWNGKPKIDEYQGGRWNPDSNIRAGAFAIIDKLNLTHANPNDGLRGIEVGLRAYYGSDDPAANQAYANAVLARINGVYLQLAQEAIAGSTNIAVDDKTTLPDGTVRELAGKIMQLQAQGRINYHVDIDRMSKGEPTFNQCGGEAVVLDKRVLQLILWLLAHPQVDTLKVTALCSDHNCHVARSGRRSAHTAGKALDIGWFHGISVAERSDRAKLMVIRMGKLIATAPAPLYPSQIISGGYGNSKYGGLDEDCQKQCVPNAAFYDLATLADHTDHIHVGY